MSDGTQDRLDRLNSSHSERGFSMANNPSPNLGRSPQRTHAMVRGQRRGQRSAVFSFYGKPEFVEEISQKTKRRTASGPGESLRDNGFVYKLQPRCRYKCLLPNCGVSRIQDGRGTFSLMRHLARSPDRHHRHAYAAVVAYNGRSLRDPAQIAADAEDIIAMPVADPADPADLEPVILTDGHRYFDRNGVPLTAPEPLIKKGTIEQYFTKTQTGSCSMASDFASDCALCPVLSPTLVSDLFWAR